MRSNGSKRLAANHRNVGQRGYNQPIMANTKILYFFNCLLDGMHTIGSLPGSLFV